jgi:hypothetical protein
VSSNLATPTSTSISRSIPSKLPYPVTVYLVGPVCGGFVENVEVTIAYLVSYNSRMRGHQSFLQSCLNFWKRQAISARRTTTLSQSDCHPDR